MAIKENPTPFRRDGAAQKTTFNTKMDLKQRKRVMNSKINKSNK